MEAQRHRGVMNNASEIDKRTREISPLSLFGASAMAFPDKISTVRGVMATRHTSQRVVLTNPEFPRVFTGAENEFGKRSSWNIKAKADYQLIKTFRKFKDAACSPVAYIFKNLSTGKYICEVVKSAHNNIEKYGFRMTNNIVGNFHDGDIISAGTTISQSASYVNDNYCGGRNLRFVYTVLPELTEDALVISDEAAEQLRYDMVDIVTVNLNKNAFLLNKYGSDGLYKPFPDIGEQIQNHIVCSVRENSYVSSVSEASIPHINDTNYYSYGTVVDIDIASNIEVENEQFNYYASQIRDWYSDIYAFISTIIVDKNQDDTSLLDIYHQADKYLNKSTWVTKEYIVDTIIKFTILQPKDIHIGQKVVGRYGNKSVITAIIPKELMPKTADGRPIHMLANGLSVPNRIISFATYESDMTFEMERIHQHIKEMYKNGSSKDEIISLVSEFVSIYNPSQGADISRLYRESPDETFDDIITNGVFIQIQPMNEVCVRDAILEADEKYADIFKPDTIYTKLRHRWIELDGAYRVGYQYTWVLKQEPSKSMSAISTGRTTLYDMPVKTRQYNKHLRRYSDNTIKFGEYDTYNLLAGIGVKSFAKITTYFRGSQYEDNSVLMSQLNNVGIDTTKYNKFPQLDNLKNVLKLLGAKLMPDIFGYNTIGNVDELQEIYINNIKINISIPDLRYILIINSYYLQYEEFVSGTVDMNDFLNKMNNTDIFEGLTETEINAIYEKFIDLLPTLQQLKKYK